MGGAEDTAIGLLIPLLLLYPSLKRSCYYPLAPILIPNISVLSFYSLAHSLLVFVSVSLPLLGIYCFALFFLSCSANIHTTYSRKSAVS